MVGATWAQDQVEIEFWHPYGPPWNVSMELAAEAFMEDFPHVKVTVTYVADLHTKLPVAVAGGTAPDVAHVWGVHRMIGFSNGVLEPLDDYLTRIPEWDSDDVIPGFLSAMEYNGSLWGLPTAAQPTSLVWSRDAFAAAGLPDVEGWADENLLSEYSRRLTKQDGGGRLDTIGFLPTAIHDGFYNWALHWGGSFFDAESGKVTAAHPANVAALTWIDELYDRYGGVAAVNEWRRNFTSDHTPLYAGKQGMAIFSHFQHSSANDVAPDWDYGFAPPPQMGDPAWGPKGLETHTDVHVVVKGSQHPIEATQFVLHSTLGEGHLKRSLTRTGHPSASISLNRRALDQDLFPQWMPRGLVMQNLEVLQRARPWPKIPVLNQFAGAVNATINQVINKQVSPGAALEDVDRTIQALLDEAINR